MRHWSFLGHLLWLSKSANMIWHHGMLLAILDLIPIERLMRSADLILATALSEVVWNTFPIFRWSLVLWVSWNSAYLATHSLLPWQPDLFFFFLFSFLILLLFSWLRVLFALENHNADRLHLHRNGRFGFQHLLEFKFFCWIFSRCFQLAIWSDVGFHGFGWIYDRSGLGVPQYSL